MNLDNFSNIRELLKTSWTLVEFTKKDGSIRSMICTTNMELIPVEQHPKKKETVDIPVDENFIVEVKEDPNPIYNVFEEGKGWRSFRHDQILKAIVDG